MRYVAKSKMWPRDVKPLARETLALSLPTHYWTMWSTRRSGPPVGLGPFSKPLCPRNFFPVRESHRWHSGATTFRSKASLSSPTGRKPSPGRPASRISTREDRGMKSERNAQRTRFLAEHSFRRVAGLRSYLDKAESLYKYELLV
jgi:hypothetical protein